MSKQTTLTGKVYIKIPKKRNINWKPGFKSSNLRNKLSVNTKKKRYFGRTLNG
jgi:hypothetical protein